ncbi:MAG: hypothetical protein B7Z12_19370, partial [Caulobacter vibrioides]
MIPLSFLRTWDHEVRAGNHHPRRLHRADERPAGEVGRPDLRRSALQSDFHFFHLAMDARDFRQAKLVDLVCGHVRR